MLRTVFNVVKVLLLIFWGFQEEVVGRSGWEKWLGEDQQGQSTRREEIMVSQLYSSASKEMELSSLQERKM